MSEPPESPSAPEPREAEAGLTLEKVGVAGDFVEGVLYARRVGGKPIFVTRVNGRFYALSNICTHQGYTITPGTTDGTTVLCPVHTAFFDIHTGQCIEGPAGDPLTVHPVRVVGEDVYVGEA